MEFDFLNKTIVVIGGTRGIGAAIVELFQEYNAEIIAIGTDTKELDRLNRESFWGKINYTHLDFTSNDSVQSFLGYLNKQDRIDVLINNAGVNRIDAINDIDEEFDFLLAEMLMAHKLKNGN